MHELKNYNGIMYNYIEESLKKSHFNRLLLTKVYNVWAKKVPTRYLS